MSDVSMVVLLGPAFPQLAGRCSQPTGSCTPPKLAPQASRTLPSPHPRPSLLPNPVARTQPRPTTVSSPPAFPLTFTATGCWPSSALYTTAKPPSPSTTSWPEASLVNCSKGGWMWEGRRREGGREGEAKRRVAQGGKADVGQGKRLPAHTPTAAARALAGSPAEATASSRAGSPHQQPGKPRSHQRLNSC